MNKENLNPLKVSITGIDGAGKSTVTGIVVTTLGQDNRVARISRPAYSIVEGYKQNHYQRLLNVVDSLHEIADRTCNKRCVLCANVLNVLLQGRIIEPGLIRRIKPDIVIGSRDYLIDPAVYAIFYSPLLAKKNMDDRITHIQRMTGIYFRDIIFFLTVPPDEAVSRIEKRIALERANSTKPERKKWRHMHEQTHHLSLLQPQYY